jgi:putative ABC transport system permease protein
LGRIPSKWPFYASWSMCIIFFSGLILWHMKDLQSGLIFIGGIFGLILIAYLLAQWMLYILKKLNMRSLAIRQAVKGLFRRGGSTKPVVITLTASLCVIFSIFLIEKNLETTFVQSFPEDLPNLFFLDIQPSQVEDFASTVGREVKLYPVVQARIETIAGEKIDRQEERRRRGDSLSRVFNVTYRDDLLDTEEIIKGRTLFQNDWKEPQISVLDTVLEMKKMNVGDKILFRIQGVPLEARISSIRTQIGESMSPFFYFVFQKEILKEAPQTIFSSLRVEKDQIAYIQNQVVSKFPNISVIDVSETIKVFSGLMKQLSVIVQFFSLLSVAAGILILISTIFATRAERIIESVYYRVLGAKKSFVFQVLALENMLIGLLSALLALALAQISTLLFCKFSFDILYRPFLWPCMLMLCAAVSLVVVIGIMTSKSIMDKKPITFLREQPDV